LSYFRRLIGVSSKKLKIAKMVGYKKW